ncbi:MAG: hypothetical protein M1269_03210 [Chloroflexi bacterium]|nr:hypothetical protein [Chloroflexota bacterium]
MKKLSFTIISVMILMLLMIPAAHAAGDDINPVVAGFTVCGNDVLDMKSLTVTKDELQAGQADIVIRINYADAPDKITGAEISLDGGNKWDVVRGKMGIFLYSFIPEEGTEYNVLVRAVTSDGRRSPAEAVVLRYNPVTNEDLIKEAMSGLAAAYRGRNVNSLMKYISKNFKDYDDFRDGIKKYFKSYKALDFTLELEKVGIEDDYSEVLFNWNKKSTPRKGKPVENSGTSSLVFAREKGTWLVVGAGGDDLFGIKQNEEKESTGALPSGTINIPHQNAFTFGNNIAIQNLTDPLADIEFDTNAILCLNGSEIYNAGTGDLSGFKTAPTAGYHGEMFNVDVLTGGIFFVKTHDGKYAKFKIINVIHENEATIEWVYQPDGTREIPGP